MSKPSRSPAPATVCLWLMINRMWSRIPQFQSKKFFFSFFFFLVGLAVAHPRFFHDSDYFGKIVWQKRMFRQWHKDTKLGTARIKLTEVFSLFVFFFGSGWAVLLLWSSRNVRWVSKMRFIRSDYYFCVGKILKDYPQKRSQELRVNCVCVHGWIQPEDNKTEWV